MITNKTIWPGYIPPQKDELLSSWLFRVSIEHQIKPHSFTLFYFKDPNIWNRDIDKYISPKITNLIQEYTPLNIHQIKDLQLGSYENTLFEGSLNPAYTEGLTNLGIYHRKRKQNGLLLCPSCISKAPYYYRKDWRLLSTIICTDCNSYLLDHCPECASPIAFQRLDIGDKSNHKEYPIYLCWNCHYDFRKAYKSVLGNNLALEYQLFINETIRTGFNELSPYSFLYFKVLFLFLKRIKTNSKLWTRIRNAFISEFNLNMPEIYQRTQYTTLQYRTIMLPLIYSLLKNRPVNFVHFCKTYKIRYSDFSKDIGNKVPFWFYRIFKESF